MRKILSRTTSSVLIVLLAAALAGATSPGTAPAGGKPAAPPARREEVNLAVAATVSTSYVSGHETLTAVNDGVTPRRSNDTSHGAYGNWPKRGRQWV